MLVRDQPQRLKHLKLTRKKDFCIEIMYKENPVAVEGQPYQHLM